MVVAPCFTENSHDGKRILQQQTVGGIRFARLGQDRQQIADADEAGGKMPALGLDVRPPDIAAALGRRSSGNSSNFSAIA